VNREREKRKEEEVRKALQKKLVRLRLSESSVVPLRQKIQDRVWGKEFGGLDFRGEKLYF